MSRALRSERKNYVALIRPDAQCAVYVFEWIYGTHRRAKKCTC